MSNYVYYNPPVKGGNFTASNPPKKPFVLKPAYIIIVTIIILIIIIILALVIRLAQPVPPTVNEPAAPNILNLASLIDLGATGQCCIPPSQVNSILTYIYDPGTDYTYSFNATPPSIVCQNEIGSNKQTCLNFVSDSSGNAKILAHFGVQYYYAFAPGQAPNVCQAYSAFCPPYQT
jgi:hypothetical protein